MTPLDAWREQLRSDPGKIIAGILEGRLDRGPWQRAEAVDFLLDLADADGAIAETTADVLLDWMRDQLIWDDRKRLLYGERAHAGQLADALAVFQRLDAPKAASRFAERHTWYESRTRPMRFDARLDLHRLLWLATAFQQRDERFLARWLEICGRAARLGDGWEEWLRIGLLGLRKLKNHAIPAERQALAGLLLFRRKAPHPMPKEAEEFETRQIEVLKELFARGPAYWPAVFAEVREQQPHTLASPAWLLAGTAPRGKTVTAWARPSKQAREKLEQRIKREPPQSVWRALESFFGDYYRYARHSGDTESLAKTVGNLGRLILGRHPATDILRPLLSWARLALDWDSGDAHRWNLVADCRIALGDFAGAKNLLWEAVRRFPRSTVCRNSLAELLRECGETIEAAALLRKTMEDFPNDAHCRTILAELLRERGATEEAQTLLRKTMEDFPSNTVCRNSLAELLRERGETDEALTLLLETVKNFPHDKVCRTILDKLRKPQAAPGGKIQAPQFGLAKSSVSTVTAPQRASTPLGSAAFDDDPLTPWAAERAPLIRIAFNFEQNRETQRLIQAARSGGAAELAEAALHLLFPEDALLREALRARPDSSALRLLAAGQNAEQGLKIADDMPETEAVLRDLYGSATDGQSWLSHFRAAVLACADLTPPPVWKWEVA